MTKYTVNLPDGTSRTRTSKRAYTHAIAAMSPSDGSWGVWGYAGSEELAKKARDSNEARCIREGEVGWKFTIIPVEIN